MRCGMGRPGLPLFPQLFRLAHHLPTQDQPHQVQTLSPVRAQTQPLCSSQGGCLYPAPRRLSILFLPPFPTELLPAQSTSSTSFLALPWVP